MVRKVQVVTELDEREWQIVVAEFEAQSWW
jgi:hypothetical protein